MSFRLSYTRAASKDLERNRLGTPMRTFETATAMRVFRGERDFCRSCGLSHLGRANPANRGRFAVAMRRATSTQGGAAR